MFLNRRFDYTAIPDVQKPLKQGGHPSWNSEGFCNPELVWKSGSAEHTAVTAGQDRAGTTPAEPFQKEVHQPLPDSCALSLGFLRSQFKDYKITCSGARPTLPEQLYSLPLMLNPPGVTYISDMTA